MSRRSERTLAGAIAGLTSLLGFLGIAELFALVTGPSSAPSIAIGENLIAHVPQSLKEFAISHFGQNDKTVLLASIYVALVVVAAAVGALAARAGRGYAAFGLMVLGLVAAVSAATQPTASPIDAVPSLAGAAAGLAAFMAIVHDQAPIGTHELGGSSPTGGAGVASGLTRRSFLTTAGSLAAFGGVAYLGARRAMNSIYNAATSRAAVRLPAPSSAARTVSGTGFALAGLGPYITPNADFYRVDTALVVPQLSAQNYTLNLHGMVDRPAIFSFDDLLGMPLIERTITMVCVSNPVGPLSRQRPLAWCATSRVARPSGRAPRGRPVVHDLLGRYDDRR